jgi:phage-related protein
MSKKRTLFAVFYRTAAGREPVRDWLRSLSPDDRKILGGDVDLVQWGWPLGRPLVDHLRDGIWEVRSSLDNRNARILFGLAGEEMVLLHGFIKKTRATPLEELDVAERRWKIWQGQQQGEQDE